MAYAHPVALRQRAVEAYERGKDAYRVVAARFSISESALMRWTWRYREEGTLERRPITGGYYSPVNRRELEKAVSARPDATSHELTRQYNRSVPADERVHRSSIVRALHRLGYVFKKNGRDPRSKTGPMWSKSAAPS